MDKVAAPAPGLVELPGSLDDPRAADGRRHRSGGVLVIALRTAPCGQEDFTAMPRFGPEKESRHRQPTSNYG